MKQVYEDKPVSTDPRVDREITELMKQLTADLEWINKRASVSGNIQASVVHRLRMLVAHTSQMASILEVYPTKLVQRYCLPEEVENG